MQITTIGLDIAKNVFQVHGVDAGGCLVLRKKLRRPEVLDLLPKSGGVGSEYHAPPRRVIASMLARASAGVR